MQPGSAANLSQILVQMRQGRIARRKRDRVERASSEAAGFASPRSISSQRARSALSQLACSSRIQLTFITVRSIDSAERQCSGGYQQQVRVGQVEKAGAFTPHGPCPDKGNRARGFPVGALPYSRCAGRNGPPGITPRAGFNSLRPYNNLSVMARVPYRASRFHDEASMCSKQLTWVKAASVS